MKSLLFTALLFSAFTANATQIISTTITIKEDGTYKKDIQFGFSEDGFTSPSTVCYIGVTSAVCDLVKQAAGATQHQYWKGGHGYFEVKSCALGKDRTVDLIYKKKNDYEGAITVGEIVRPCF